MREFMEMFPTLDEEVIESALRANNGSVDETLNCLLDITTDPLEAERIIGHYGAPLSRPSRPDGKSRYSSEHKTDVQIYL